MKVTVKAPAKINLTLDIIGKRPDGYHDVAMVMQTVSLYDTVTVENGDNGDEIKSVRRRERSSPIQVSSLSPLISK